VLRAAGDSDEASVEEMVVSSAFVLSVLPDTSVAVGGSGKGPPVTVTVWVARALFPSVVV